MKIRSFHSPKLQVVPSGRHRRLAGVDVCPRDAPFKPGPADQPGGGRREGAEPSRSGRSLAGARHEGATLAHVRAVFDRRPPWHACCAAAAEKRGRPLRTPSAPMRGALPRTAAAQTPPQKRMQRCRRPPLLPRTAAAQTPPHTAARASRIPAAAYSRRAQTCAHVRMRRRL